MNGGTTVGTSEKLQLEGQKFRERLLLTVEWFQGFTDNEKEITLRTLLEECDEVQVHAIFGFIQKHQPSSRNPFDVLPAFVALKILSFLDPVSLCCAGGVCRGWKKLVEDASLWKRFCSSPDQWRLSTVVAEAKQLTRFQDNNGSTNWKDLFAERFRVWRNWSKGRCVVRTFEGHTEGISCVQFDEDHIVSGSSDNTIKLWDMRSNNRLHMNLTGHSSTVRCLHLTGSRLASGSNDCSIKIWDLNVTTDWSGIACRLSLLGHQKTVRCLQDVKALGSAHWSKYSDVKVDETKILSGSADNSVKVWDINSGSCVMTLHNAHADAVTCLYYDDQRIVSGSLDRCIKFWDLRTGRWLTTLDWTQHEGHTGVIRCLQADRWRLISAADDKTLKIWSLQTGKRLATLKSHTDGVTCLQFNDFRIVSGSFDKTIKLWDFSIC